jgi:uncharacterized protein DUF4229
VAESANLGRDLALYTAARVGLVAVVTAGMLVAGIPLLVSIAVALVVGFPLGILLFRGLNERVTAGLAARGGERATERARLRAQLRGDEEPAEGER